MVEGSHPIAQEAELSLETVENLKRNRLSFQGIKNTTSSGSFICLNNRIAASVPI